MLNRREFIFSSLAVTGCLAAEKLFGLPTSRPIGVQVYTVRKQAEKDLPGVLAALHKIGYEEVELYWNLYKHSAAELSKMLADHGLRAPSGHFDYDGLESKFDYARALGVKYFICPMLPERMRTSLDGFKQAADRFNAWGEKTKRLGMQFGFHNHNYEFRSFGGTTGFDTLLARTDPQLVSLEIDCYWLAQAGRDPVQMLQQLGTRTRLLHVKDRKPGFPPSQRLNKAAYHFTEVGTGNINWKEVLAAAQANGVEHYFVEQDYTVGPPLESLAISYRNLRPLM